MAPDGRCKALDAAADGYVRAEAAVVILLHSTSLWEAGFGGSTQGQMAALLLASTAVNQDGRSSSLTAPHGPSQQAVVLAATSAAGVAAAELHAVEMHGTGRCLRGSCCLLWWFIDVWCFPWVSVAAVAISEAGSSATAHARTTDFLAMRLSCH